MKHSTIIIIFFIALSSLTYAALIENPYNPNLGSQTIQFSKGWNLVYGFAYPKQVQDLWDTKHIKAIYAFVPNIQKFASLYPEADRDISAIDDDILVNTAFWVYVDEDRRGNYWLLDEIVPFDERPLYVGWNLFGITPDMLKVIISRGNCTIEKMAVWDSYAQKWEVVTEETLEQYGMNWDAFSLADDQGDLGRGIAIKVSNNCKLSKSIQSPPSMLYE